MVEGRFDLLLLDAWLASELVRVVLHIDGSRCRT